MSNGAERMEYPAPLYGGGPERDMQLRQYLFQMTDYINRLTGRVEDLERALQAANEGA